MGLPVCDEAWEHVPGAGYWLVAMCQQYLISIVAARICMHSTATHLIALGWLTKATVLALRIAVCAIHHRNRLGWLHSLLSPAHTNRCTPDAQGGNVSRWTGVNRMYTQRRTFLDSGSEASGCIQQSRSPGVEESRCIENRSGKDTSEVRGMGQNWSVDVPTPFYNPIL